MTPHRTLLAALACAAWILTAHADPDDPAAPASDAVTTIATRSAPSKEAELVQAKSLAAWLPGAIVAVYSTPVPYETPTPEDRNIVALLLVPDAGNAYRSILIDTFGPEGANAQVIAVALAPRKSSAVPVLTLEVQWLNNHGEILQTCSYLRPKLMPPPARLERVDDTSCFHE